MWMASSKSLASSGSIVKMFFVAEVEPPGDLVVGDRERDLLGLLLDGLGEVGLDALAEGDGEDGDAGVVRPAEHFEHAALGGGLRVVVLLDRDDDLVALRRPVEVLLGDVDVLRHPLVVGLDEGEVPHLVERADGPRPPAFEDLDDLRLAVAVAALAADGGGERDRARGRRRGPF